MSLAQQQLDELDETREVRIETSTNGKSTRTIIWVVVVDGDVYVRSVNGDAGNWYQRARSNPSVAIEIGGVVIDFEAVHVDDQETIDIVTRALRAKYPAGGSLDRMTRDEVLGTTLRLEPKS